MEVRLKRLGETENSTFGNVYVDGKWFCYSLELLWRYNERSVSCIPKGKYLLKKRVTENRGEHILVSSVPNRSFILIHSAATHKDLRGCISFAYRQSFEKNEVTNSQSKMAVNDFNKLFFECKSDVWLIID